MGSAAGNDQNTLSVWFSCKCFGIKMQGNVQWFRNFQMTCNARKTLWMALYARKLKTEIVKICSWNTVENCRGKHCELKSIRNRKEFWMSIFRSKMRVWHSLWALNIIVELNWGDIINSKNVLAWTIFY